MTVGYVIPELENATSVLTRLAGQRGIDPLAWPYTFPVPHKREALDLKDMAEEILQLTRWSNRQFASALGTTHPTVRAILQGQAEGPIWRNSEYRLYLRQMHAVISRISILVGSDRTRLRSILAQTTSSGSSLEHMTAGRFNDAYLAAVDALRPASRPGRLLNGNYPRRPGESPVGLDDVG
jgi:hypothetical protein